MTFLKIALGLTALLIAWAYIFHNKLIFQVNAWMRDRVFSDRVVLFSGRRVAALLLVLGCVCLFSGIQNIVQVQPIKANIAAQILEQAQQDFREKKYPLVINRCRVLVRANPSSAEAWELLATSWWALGDKAKARQAAETLLRLQPNHPTAINLLHAEDEKKKKAQK